MVKEILSKEVIERSSGVKFSTMTDFYEWHVKLFLLTCTLQSIYFYVIWIINCLVMHCYSCVVVVVVVVVFNL